MSDIEQNKQKVLTLADFPHCRDERVRYRDTDRQGHVDNAVFSTFYECSKAPECKWWHWCRWQDRCRRPSWWCPTHPVAPTFTAAHAGLVGTGGGVIVAPGVNVMSGAFTCIIIWYLLYRQSRLCIDSRRVVSKFRPLCVGWIAYPVRQHTLCVTLRVLPACRFVCVVRGRDEARLRSR